jgi:simple sugar transport system permease protein
MLTGANFKAAEYCGFNKPRIMMATCSLFGVLAGFAEVIIAARSVNVKWGYGNTYLLIAIPIAVLAGVRPQGGYGRISCVVLSAIVWQLLHSLLNFIGFSNFVRDLPWGALLLCFLAIGRFGPIEQLALFIPSMRIPHESKS